MADVADIQAARQQKDDEVARSLREAEKLIEKGWKLKRVESDNQKRSLFFRKEKDMHKDGAEEKVVEEKLDR